MAKVKIKNSGFTLIELLVVISIIGLLSTLAIVSLSAARDKAKATRIVSDFKTIEKALIMLMDAENQAHWWLEGEKSTNLSSISGLSAYLKTAPTPPISGSYSFDNDGDALQTPSSGCCSGVNIGLNSCGSFCTQFFNLVDQIVDNGDGKFYGKIRSDGAYSYIL